MTKLRFPSSEFAKKFGNCTSFNTTYKALKGKQVYERVKALSPPRSVSSCFDPVVINTNSDRRAWTSVADLKLRGIILSAMKEVVSSSP